jgi:chemotaxis protein histidine kinase CheA
LVRKTVEHFQGKYAVETREGVGTIRTLLLPAA